MSRFAFLAALAILLAGCRLEVPTAPQAQALQRTEGRLDHELIHPCECPDFSNLKAVLYPNGRFRISGDYAPHCPGVEPTFGMDERDWSMHVVIRAAAPPHWRIFAGEEFYRLAKSDSPSVTLARIYPKVKKGWFVMDVPTEIITGLSSEMRVEWRASANISNGTGSSHSTGAVLPIQRQGNTEGITPIDPELPIARR